MVNDKWSYNPAHAATSVYNICMAFGVFNTMQPFEDVKIYAPPECSNLLLLFLKVKHSVV